MLPHTFSQGSKECWFDFVYWLHRESLYLLSLSSSLHSSFLYLLRLSWTKPWRGRYLDVYYFNTSATISVYHNVTYQGPITLCGFPSRICGIFFFLSKYARRCFPILHFFVTERPNLLPTGPKRCASWTSNTRTATVNVTATQKLGRFVMPKKLKEIWVWG